MYISMTVLYELKKMLSVRWQFGFYEMVGSSSCGSCIHSIVCSICGIDALRGFINCYHLNLYGSALRILTVICTKYVAVSCLTNNAIFI